MYGYIDCTISHNQEDGVRFVWMRMRGWANLQLIITNGLMEETVTTTSTEFFIPYQHMVIIYI